MSAVENDDVAGPGRPMTRDEVYELGCEIIGHGVGVFPIKLRKSPNADKVEKAPLTKHGHLSATVDQGKWKQLLDSCVKRLPDGYELGLGIHPGPSGFGAIDYDTKGGAPGGEQLERHTAQYGEEFQDVSYYSISGATNVLLAKPENKEIRNEDQLWDGVEVRFDNGWIVPPGVFTTWGEWGWRSGGWDDIANNVVPAEVWSMLRSPSAVESEPAANARVEEWLDENALTALPNAFNDKMLDRFVARMATAGSRNPAMVDAINWVKRQNEGIDRRAAFERIDAAWRKRMIADGEADRVDQCAEYLARAVGYDDKFKAAEATQSLEAAAPVGVEMEEGQTPLDVIRSKAITTSDLANIPMPEALVDGYLFRDSLAWLIGPSGVGKSFVAVDIAMKIATGGGTWHNKDVKAGRVLYVAAEGVAGMNMRTQAWRKLYGVTEEPDAMWIPMAINVSDARWAEGLAEYVAEESFDLVVLDTLARSSVGAEENSAMDAGIIINHLDQIRVASGACVLLIHHSGKNKEAGGRGSTAFKGALESELTLSGSVGSIVTVASTKQKNVEEVAPIQFKPKKIELGGGIGPDGEELSSIVLVPASAEDLDEIESDGHDEASSTSDRRARQNRDVMRVLQRQRGAQSMSAIKRHTTPGLVGKDALRGILEDFIFQGFVIEVKGDHGARAFVLSENGLKWVDSGD